MNGLRKERKNEQGASVIEFAFVALTLAPMLAGIGVTGVNLVRTLQTERLARDAGHMYAHGVDFSAAGNRQIPANTGGSLNLRTIAGSDSAVLILSTLAYVDKSACATGGAVDSNGNPSGCTNLGKWVFARRMTLGNSTIRSSALGTPKGLTIDSTTGVIAASDYVTKAGAVANLSSIHPHSNVAGTVTGVPSGQVLYVAEASAAEYALPPYTGGATYAYGLF